MDAGASSLTHVWSTTLELQTLHLIDSGFLVSNLCQVQMANITVCMTQLLPSDES